MDKQRASSSSAAPSSAQGGSVPPGTSPRGGLAPSGRLSTIRPARDLTLGGVTKRVFTPKIPSQRKKDSDGPVIKQESDRGRAPGSSSGRGSPGRGRGRGESFRGGRGRGSRGRGRGRGERKVIESETIFSAGPAESTNRRSYSWSGGGGGGASFGPPVFTRTGGAGGGGGGGGSGGKGGSSFGPSAAISVKSEPIDGEMLPIGLGTDEYEGLFASDDDSDDLMDVGYDVMPPVQLPLSVEARNAHLAIKQEKDQDDMRQILTRPPEDEREELVFFQLPDTLPAAGRSVDGEKVPEGGEKMTLANLPEGYLGQLVIRKSGRVQLILGSVSLDVDLTGKSPCYQEVVSVRAKSESDSAEGSQPNGMYFLGQVEHQLVCTPNFEDLLNS